MADSIFTVFKAQLDRRVLVLDGALGTMIQQYNLAESDFRGNLFGDVSQQIKGDNDVLNLTRPDVIAEIHEKSILSMLLLLAKPTMVCKLMSEK